MKKAVEVVGLILIILFSVGSGIAFSFPKAWHFNFQVSLFTIAKTFLTLVLSVGVLAYVKRGEKHE